MHPGTEMHQQLPHVVVALLNPFAQLASNLLRLAHLALAQRILQHLHLNVQEGQTLGD